MTFAPLEAHQGPADPPANQNAVFELSMTVATTRSAWTRSSGSWF